MRIGLDGVVSQELEEDREIEKEGGERRRFKGPVKKIERRRMRKGKIKKRRERRSNGEEKEKGENI